MRRIFVIVVAVGALTGCGTSYQITKECYEENPMPASAQTGQFFGLIGMGAAYLADGSNISAVNQRRADCIDQRKAALAASN